MKRKNRLSALLCTLAILCALAVPAAGSSGNTPVYLLATNDKFCDLPGKNRTIRVKALLN